MRHVSRGARAAVLLLVVALLAACGAAGSTIAPATNPPPITGIVVSVDSHGLGDVRGFSLRTVDGRVIAFRIGTLDNGAAFPPGHLAEHLATAEPVRVFFRSESGGLVAYRIEDAAVASQSPSPTSS